MAGGPQELSRLDRAAPNTHSGASGSPLHPAGRGPQLEAASRESKPTVSAELTDKDARANTAGYRTSPFVYEIPDKGRAYDQTTSLPKYLIIKSWNQRFLASARDLEFQCGPLCHILCIILCINLRTTGVLLSVSLSPGITCTSVARGIVCSWRGLMIIPAPVTCCRRH